MTEPITAKPTLTPNAYWEAVRPHVGAGMSGRHVARWIDHRHPSYAIRGDLVRHYSWTITDPDTITFVVDHSRGRILDPMAGTGWWAHLLAHAGVDCVASDLHGPTDNDWHLNAHHHAPVELADAPDAAARHADRTLLLSWPPYDDPAGADTIAAYQGDRIIYMGEDRGDCCGTDEMFDQLDRHWTLTAHRTPVQWDGMHDQVLVYDRRRPT